MSIFSSYKKIFLLGFIVVILVAIPFSVYIAQKRQNITSKADASTTLSLEPASSTVKVGETLTLDIFLDPKSVTGKSPNQVSFVKLSINFDASKFTTLSDSLEANPESSNALTTIIENPKYESGKASISLSIGPDPANALTAKTKIAILRLKAANTITPTAPNITFAPDTQVLSISFSDEAGENVLSTTIPATVTVAVAITPTPSPDLTVTPAVSPSPLTLTPTPGVGGLPASLLTPVCSNLIVNGPASGTAPYTLTFTAIGSDSDGTINKISFNFGDSIENLIEGGGIETNSISAQMSHTYKTPGIYTAFAILTDNDNNLSVQQDSCTKVITINQSLQLSPTIIGQVSLPPTGDGKIMFGLGVLGVIITIIGGALLLL